MDAETREQLAKLAAAADQAKGAAKEIASLLGVLRAELIANGFTEAETLAMCITQLQIIMSSGSED